MGDIFLNHRVAVVDDSLARGRTAEALGEIVEDAHDTVVAAAFAIEKTSMGGRALPARPPWPIISLVRVGSHSGGAATFTD